MSLHCAKTRLKILNVQYLTFLNPNLERFLTKLFLIGLVIRSYISNHQKLADWRSENATRAQLGARWYKTCTIAYALFQKCWTSYDCLFFVHFLACFRFKESFLLNILQRRAANSFFDRDMPTSIFESWDSDSTRHEKSPFFKTVRWSSNYLHNIQGVH